MLNTMIARAKALIAISLLLAAATQIGQLTAAASSVGSSCNPKPVATADSSASTHSR